MKPPIPIAKPCTADWTKMTGDDRRRLCAQCDKHVHNLSALTPHELQHFVETRDGTECIGYVFRPNGTIVTASRWSRLARWLHPITRPFTWLLAVLLPSLFTGCAQTRPPDYLGGRLVPGEPCPPKTKTIRGTCNGQMLMGAVALPPSRERTPQ